jgi:hypothetical protein
MGQTLPVLGIIALLILIFALPFILKYLLKLRAEPEEEAKKVRKFFRLLSAELSKSGIGPLEMTESGSTFIQTTDHWRMTAKSRGLAWGLQVILFYRTTPIPKDSILQISFEWTDTGGSASQKEAEQMVHRIITPLVTGSIYKSVAGDLSVIPQYSYTLGMGILDLPKDLATCLIAQVESYCNLRRALEEETKKIADHLGGIEFVKSNVNRIVSGALIEYAKGEKIDPRLSLQILTSLPPAQA